MVDLGNTNQETLANSGQRWITIGLFLRSIGAVMKYLSSTKLIQRCPYTPEYHFDSEIMDARWDTIIPLGNLQFTLAKQEIDTLIGVSEAIACELGKYGKAEIDTSKSYASRDPKYVINNMTYKIPKILQKVGDSFGLESTESRVHVQLPGQVWNLHIDKLQKWVKDKPQDVMRFIIHLSDWEPGHFWNYGNYSHSHWRYGDVHTFDWQQVPHCTANAGLYPRLTLQVTGLATEQTRHWLQTLKMNKQVNIT